ncbi:MAG TPA: FAD-dependent oxidoreductase [Kiloniellales bacterium]|nr:FAD-dependent oxidoreductase [Kiloniellales bacterium]
MASIAIIGAGFLGLSSAYWLRRDGHQVTLFDPRGAAGGASFGNAGTFATYACIPVNNPGVFRDFHRYLFSAQSPFRLRLGYLPRLTPWLLRFLLSSTPSRYEQSAEALSQLLARAYAGYEDLIREAGLEHFLCRRGALYLYSSKRGYEAAEAALALRRKLGVQLEILAPQALQELEPELAAIFHRAVRFRDTWHLLDPAGFLTALQDWLVSRGMQLEREAVDRLEPRKEEVRLLTPGGAHSFDRVVVAAGAFSGKFAQQCGDPIPLDTERGYHVTFRGGEGLVSRPVGWAERGFYMTPMTGGLRAAGTVELAGLVDRKNPALLELLRYSAQRALPRLPQAGESWLGFRPTLPDGLPVLGRSSTSARVLYAFGHQHIGLTLGGLSGRLIADLIEERPPLLDLSACSPQRFRRSAPSI